MVGVATRGIAAKVVDGQAVGNWPLSQFISKAVNVDVARADTDAGIAPHHLGVSGFHTAVRQQSAALCDALLDVACGHSRHCR